MTLCTFCQQQTNYIYRDTRRPINDNKSLISCCKPCASDKLYLIYQIKIKAKNIQSKRKSIFLV